MEGPELVRSICALNRPWRNALEDAERDREAEDADEQSNPTVTVSPAAAALVLLAVVLGVLVMLVRG